MQVKIKKLHEGAKVPSYSKERNVGKLYLAISHLTVSNPNPELVDLYDTIFTTNSKGIKYDPIVNDIKVLEYRNKTINF